MYAESRQMSDVSSQFLFTPIKMLPASDLHFVDEKDINEHKFQANLKI